MIRNTGFKLSFSVSFFIAIIFHLVILFFVKKSGPNFGILSSEFFRSSRPLKIDRIELIKPEELEKLKRVGVKNGAKKDFFQPDLIKIPKAAPPQSPHLSLGNLAPDFSAPQTAKKGSAGKLEKSRKEIVKNQNLPESIARSSEASEESGAHFYFNPKKEKKISQNREQNELKQEAYKNITASSSNPVAQKISNFEIRYERPEGVSEDELNSDEKAYYSFFKRSYANYLSKLYATYDKISVERPGLDRDFSNKHLLIGRIDYDDKGNIVTVKILKSSESDDVHYFFEETLKQLNLPNPPKSFVKNKKQFSTYYQIQIN